MIKCKYDFFRHKGEKMAKIFTVASGKGGVGKSTFCANIALSLEKLNKKVLLIDGDVCLRSLDLLLSVDEMVVYDWLDVLENRCDKDKARLFFSDNIQLLPAPSEYPENMTCELFGSLLNQYRDEYDYIFIDSPAGTGALPLCFAQCADTCLAVATPDEISARAACVLGNQLTAKGIKEENLRLIINRFDEKCVKKGKMLNADDMIDRTYIRLLGIIPEEPDLMCSSVTGKQLFDYSDAKTAFDNIAGRITGKEIPLIL